MFCNFPSFLLNHNEMYSRKFDSSIFEEDEVCIPTSSGGFKYGLVVESSQYLSSDEEDEEDEDRVRRGTVKVAWHPNGEETVVTEKKLILADRSLVPGDVVRRLISGKESQRGFVQDTETKCHIKILGTDQYIYNIDARDIEPLQEWDPEPEVTLDSWVGHALEVHEDITVRFSDGARCCLSNAGLLSLEDINDKRKHYSEFAMRNFYPSQELCGTSEDYEDAKWLHTSSTRGPGKMGTRALYSASVVVEKVETDRVDVRWICKGFTKSDKEEEKLETPPGVVQGDKLKHMRQLDCFRYSHLQIGDKCYYTVKDNDVLLRNMSPRQHATPDIVELVSHENVTVLGTSADGIVIGKGQNKTKLDKDKTTAAVNPGEMAKDTDDGDCGDDEFEDVDDSNEESDASTEAVGPAPRRKNRKRPILHTKNLKRMMGKRAKRKQKLPEREVAPGDKVPMEVCYTFSRCTVVWQDGSIEENIPSPELFPIHHLDDLEFFPGDFVIDSKDNMKTDYGVVVSCDHKERTVMVKWIKPYNPGKTSKPEESTTEELSVYDVKDHLDYKFRPGHTVIRVGGYEVEGSGEVEAVGQVHRLNPDGTISIWWPNKTTSVCYPQELYIISEEFQSELGSTDDWSDEEEEEEEEEGSDVSWETEDETDADTEDDDAKKDKSKLWTVSDGKKKDLDELLKRVQAALSGLLEVFINVPGPFFKNSRQVFQDILTIFKRCKEMEKILKSAYFDDDEIADLISEIKEQLRREKTAKLARHVAEVHRYRSSLYNEKSEDTVVESKNGLDSAVNEKGEGEKTESKSETEELPVEGATCKSDNDSDSATERLRKALTEFGSNIEDPLLQIIFDTSLHVTVAKSAQKSLEQSLKQTQITDDNADTKKKESGIHENGVGAELMEEKDLCANGIDMDVSIKEKKDGNVEDIIETVIKAVCEKDCVLDKELNAVREKIRLAYNATSSVKAQECDKVCMNSETAPDQCLPNATEAESAKKSPTHSQNQLVNGGLPEHSDKETNTEEVLPSSHRTLCIRVCKALNARLLYIQQEVNRRWLAYKFGLDENEPESEIFKKMQEKMVESIESGQGPLSLAADVPRGENSAVDASTDTRDAGSQDGSRSSLSQGQEGDSEELDVAETEEETQRFEVCSEAPSSHWFKYQEHKPDHPKSFNTAIRKEMMLLRSSLPDGILVKGFEDRMDLYSVMIKGPVHTPYEDGLFSFDVQLPASFPSSPPVFHYLSFCNERLNPNLYEDGKVCVSLLGTWSGKGNEVWTNKSSLLQVLVSIQGLILVPEPYFNEAGYEKQRGSQLGQENSRMYNEMAILKLIQSKDGLKKMAISPPTMFAEETRSHLEGHAKSMIDRIQGWLDISEKQRAQCADGPSTSNHSDDTSKLCDSVTCNGTADIIKPDFPLLPASKGFCLTMRKNLEQFKKVLADSIFKGEV